MTIYMTYLNAINTPNNFDQEDFQSKYLQLKTHVFFSCASKYRLHIWVDIKILSEANSNVLEILHSKLAFLVN